MPRKLFRNNTRSSVQGELARTRSIVPTRDVLVMAAVPGALPTEIVEQAARAGIDAKAASSLFQAFVAFDSDNSGSIDTKEL